MRTAFLDVIEFETACGHPPTAGPPKVDSLKLIGLRRDLIKEEYDEAMGALEVLECAVSDGHSPGPGQLDDIADALADLIWVAIGTAVRFGIDLPAVWAEVRRSNMAKFGPGSWRREDGKLMKPPGWTPPDVAGVLAGQRPLATAYDLAAEGQATNALLAALMAHSDALVGTKAANTMRQAAAEIVRLRHRRTQVL